MDALLKLQQAVQHMKDAEQLINEAKLANESLEQHYGYSLDIIAQELNKYSDNSRGYHMKFNTSLDEIINAEGSAWKKKINTNAIPGSTSQQLEDSYFPVSLREWITTLLVSDTSSTNEQIVKWLVEKGIQKDIATSIVVSERKACIQRGRNYQIDFSLFEPEDDRIFSSSDMFDFAYGIGQDAMSAGFMGNKTINDLSLTDYINEQLDLHEGDASYERWIPRREWPKHIQEGSALQPRRKNESAKRKPGKGEKRTK